MWISSSQLIQLFATLISSFKEVPNGKLEFFVHKTLQKNSLEYIFKTGYFKMPKDSPKTWSKSKISIKEDIPY